MIMLLSISYLWTTKNLAIFCTIRCALAHRFRNYIDFVKISSILLV